MQIKPLYRKVNTVSANNEFTHWNQILFFQIKTSHYRWKIQDIQIRKTRKFTQGNIVHFEDKTTPEGQQGCLVLARQYLGSPGTCNPEENGLPGLPFSWSESGPVELPPVPWTEKQFKGPHFSPDAEVIAGAETWLDRQTSDFFWVPCKI